MASTTIELTSSKAWKGIIRCSATTYISGGYMELYVYAGMWKTDGYLTSSNYPTSGTITIDGNSYDLVGYQEFEDEVCIFEDTFTFYPDSDGTKTVAISLSCKGQSGTSLAGYTLSGQGEIVFDPIPQNSSLSCTGSVLGESATLSIDSDSTSLTHTITYKCGSTSGTICSKSSSRSVKWTPPLSLASQAPSSTSVSITFTLIAYSGSAQVNKDTVTVSFSIPASVVPSVSVEVSDAKGYLGIYGAYVQSKSTVKAVLTSTGIYGSTISNRQVSFEGSTYFGSTVTTDAIKGSGTLKLTATVKDSRGRTSSASVDITVISYSAPDIFDLTAERCDEDGTRNATGSYLAVKFSATVTSLNNKNSAAYTLRYKKSSEFSYTEVSLNALSGKYSVSQYEYIFSADKSASYNVAIVIKDDFPAVSKSAIGSSEMTLISHLAKGVGFAIGKIAERVGYLDMGFHIFMNEKRIHGLKDPVDDDEVATKGWVEALLRDAGVSITSQSDDS